MKKEFEKKIEDEKNNYEAQLAESRKVILIVHEKYTFLLILLFIKIGQKQLKDLLRGLDT